LEPLGLDLSKTFQNTIIFIAQIIKIHPKPIKSQGFIRADEVPVIEISWFLLVFDLFLDLLFESFFQEPSDARSRSPFTGVEVSPTGKSCSKTSQKRAPK